MGRLGIIKIINRFCIYIFFLTLFVFATNSHPQYKVSFEYGILSKYSEIKELKNLSIINTGDYVRINVGYHKDTYFYLVYKNSEGEFSLIYSKEHTHTKESLWKFSESFIYATALYWSKFTNPKGFETFYFINSIYSQEELLNLLEKYYRANEKGRTKISKRIQNRLDELNPNIKQSLDMIVSRYEKPTIGGVTFRSDEDDSLKDMSLTHGCVGKNGLAFVEIKLNHK